LTFFLFFSQPILLYLLFVTRRFFFSLLAERFGEVAPDIEKKQQRTWSASALRRDENEGGEKKNTSKTGKERLPAV
jgi:hypothetical protein